MSKRKFVRVDGELYDFAGYSDQEIQEIVHSGRNLLSWKVFVPPIRKGFHTETVRGTVNYVNSRSNEFFHEMGAFYPTFRVVSASTVSLPDSVCMYIVYEI